MTEVKCDLTYCKYNEKGICNAAEIDLEGGECDDFLNFRWNNQEYNHPYWKACHHIHDDQTITQYRTQAHGKKYEALGFVFFTGDDIRFGIEDAWFTEEISGRGINGKTLMPNDENTRRQIQEQVDKCGSVMDLPWMDEGFDGPVPHEEKEA